MDDRLRGRYPGGPSRDPNPPAAPRRLPGVGGIEAARADRIERGLRQRRRRRVSLGFAATLLASMVVGGWLGVESHVTPEEVAREREAVERGLDAELRGEADRVLRELWLMEALER